MIFETGSDRIKKHCFIKTNLSSLLKLSNENIDWIKIQLVEDSNSSEVAKCACSGLGKQENERSVLSQGQHGSHRKITPILFYTYVSWIPNYSIR